MRSTHNQQLNLVLVRTVLNAPKSERVPTVRIGSIMPIHNTVILLPDRAMTLPCGSVVLRTLAFIKI